MAVSDIYDTFFLDDGKEFFYVGYPNEITGNKPREQFAAAMDLLYQINAGKYIIQNDVTLDFKPQ